MSRNQKAPLLAFVIVALVCCMVLVDSMRGDASDGQESASSSPPAASASVDDQELGLPASADDPEPSPDAPFELSLPFGAGSTGSVGPARGSSGPEDAVRGDAASPSTDGLTNFEPGAGGGPGSESEPGQEIGGDEATDEVGEGDDESPRKVKRRGHGIKDPTGHLPDHPPSVDNPDSAHPDPAQTESEQPGNGQPSAGQPSAGQSSVGQPDASPSAPSSSPAPRELTSSAQPDPGKEK